MRKILATLILATIAGLFIAGALNVVTADGGKDKPKPTQTEQPKDTDTPEPPKETETDEPKETATPDGPKDNDSDGIIDEIDGDDDNDGWLDEQDNCQYDANPDQQDTDGDKVGDACDEDDDGDKINDDDEKEYGTDPEDDDSDKDGCQDGVEMGDKPSDGGDRDPLNSWDYYDVAGGAGGAPDQYIDLANDILGVIQHYSPNGGDGYDETYDRGPSNGNSWTETAPPDGVIDLSNDILGVISQYLHDCR